MKKIVILFISIFILTGCNVQYNLTISEDNIIENIDLISENENESNILYNYFKPIEVFENSPNYSESNEKIPGVEYYITNKYLSNGLYTLNMNYTYEFDKYQIGYIINNSVSVIKLEENNGVYNFNTGATFKIFDSYDINNLTVKITLDNKYELINCNANEINENVYIWNINRENYKTKPITLSFRKIENENENNEHNIDTNNDKDNDTNQNENTSNNIFLLVLTFVGFIIILIIIVIVKNKMNNRNNF